MQNDRKLIKINTVYEYLFLSDTYTLSEISENTGVEIYEVRDIIKEFIKIGVGFEMSSKSNWKEPVIEIGFDDDEEGNIDSFGDGVTFQMSFYGEKNERNKERTVKEKLIALELSQSEKELLEKIISPDEAPEDNTHFRIKNNAFSDNKDDNYCVEELQKYISKQKCCSIIYNPRMHAEDGEDDERKLTVYPLRLLFDIENNRSYLAGTDLKDEKKRVLFWRIDKIADVFSCDDYEDEAVYKVQKSLIKKIEKKNRKIVEKLPTAELHYSETGRILKTKIKLLVYDEVGVLQKLKKFLGEEDGSFTRTKEYDMEDDFNPGKMVECYLFEGKVYGIRKFMHWLRRFGSSVVVLEPKEERERMKKIASFWSDMYKETEEDGSDI